MSVGHIIMSIIDKNFELGKFIGAGIVGFLGLFFLVVGVFKNDNSSIAALFGFLAGVFIWTGWVEFSFVWIAEKLNVQPLIENGEIATRPEYLVMMSSVGLLAAILLLFLFQQTRCQFFNWFQKIFRFKNQVKLATKNYRPMAVNVFIETIMILWFFYILLLFVYDDDIAGDKHPITIFVAFGSLFWSLYLGLQLIKIQKFDYAIRYAIPTAIIFWNFIEVIGRWDFFTEIWVHPKEYWIQNSIIMLLLIGFIVYYIVETARNKKNIS